MNGMTRSLIAEFMDRRTFVKGACALSVAHLTLRAGRAATAAPANSSRFAYVGTYTGAVGAGSNGEGIYLFDVNPATGQLSNRKLAAKSPDPSWIAIHPSKRFLYAVNEVSDYNGKSGSVSAFAIDQATGNLRSLNVVDSEGAGPCFLSIAASGRYAFVANYGGGSAAVLPILEDGSLAKAANIHRDTGELGSAQARDAPAGSFAVSGHDAPHAHTILPDPKGKFVLATDLGQDRIYTYQFNLSDGNLTSTETAPAAELPSGDGPRHLAFHPNGHWLYSIQEEASNIAFFHYDPETGSLSAQQTITTLPTGFAGTSFASEILIAPSGKFLYAANRLLDTIAVFALATDGRLKAIGETSTMGDYPGQCRIDPNGGFLYACNRRSDNITSFRIHRETGLLTFTGQYTAVGSPASITFLD
jgi:6-phosphogluconolactonase